MEFRARCDRSLIRSGARSRRVVKVEVTAPEAAAAAKRPSLTLSLVLDRSGSMGGEKFALARQAAVAAIRALRPGDRFSVVLYDNRVDVLQPTVEVSPATVAAAVERLERVRERGNTDLCGGWLAGCEQVAAGLGPDRLGRVLVLSDGLANEGVTDTAAIVERASGLRVRGVTTSTFGIGFDYDERLLAGMAEAGGGNFRFVATAAEIPGFVADEVAEALDVTLPEAEIAVSGAGGLVVECPNGYPVRQVDEEWRVAIGSLVSGQSFSLLLDLRFPVTSEGESCAVRLALLTKGGAAAVAPVELAFAGAGHSANDGQPVDSELRRERARLEASAVRRRALERKGVGDDDGAVALTKEAAERIRKSAFGDQAVLELAAELAKEADELQRPIDEWELKRRHAVHYYGIKGRLVQGAALRHRPLRSAILCEGPLRAALDDTERAFWQTRLPAINPRICTVRPEELPPDWTGTAPPTREEESRLAAALRGVAIPENAPVVFFTARPLADEWFSHWHPSEQVAIVSTAGVDLITSAPLSSFAAYEVLLHGLRELGAAPEALLHAETRGCLYDLCEDRKEIDRKLHVATFCGPCRAALERLHLLPHPAGTMADVVRELAAALSPAVN